MYTELAAYCIESIVTQHLHQGCWIYDQLSAAVETKSFIDEMPGREVWDENFCYICLESFKFYNCLDKYFHFLRHYNENSLKVFILKLLLNHKVASIHSQYSSVVLISWPILGANSNSCKSCCSSLSQSLTSSEIILN